MFTEYVVYTILNSIKRTSVKQKFGFFSLALFLSFYIATIRTYDTSKSVWMAYVKKTSSMY